MNKKLLNVAFTFAMLTSCSSVSNTTTSDNSLPSDNGEYSIVYHLDGGEVQVENPSSYTKDTTDFQLSKPCKMGHYFNGWTTADDNYPILNKIIKKGTTGNLEFFAQYSKNDASYCGETIDVLPNGMRGYLECSNDDVADYLYNFWKSADVDAGPKEIPLSWVNINHAENMTLTIATDNNYQNIAYTQTSNEIQYTVKNYIPNTYYVRVVDSLGELIYKDEFTIKGNLRTIKCDGITNMRDIGGWKLEDGSSIPYGKVYRSSDVQMVTSEGKEVLKELGIKTEVDLRKDSTATSAPLDNMNFVNAGIWTWCSLFPGSSSSYDAESVKNIKTALLAYANKDNYPIIAHCAGGADRTGTLLFVIEALLGMQYEDLVRDFELTTFSPKGVRYRTGIKEVDGKYQFDDSVNTIDGSGVVVMFDKVYKHIINTYCEDGSSLSQGMEKYLKNVVGLTTEDITAIKQNILE